MAEPRPLLRGVSHQMAFYVALALGLALVASARDARAAVCAAIYGALLATMFGVSATLHRGDWSPRVHVWLRRADHATIFAFIAGTYTPLCLVGIGGATGTRLLTLAWTGAALGILRALFWPHAPRAVSSVLYVLVGWVMVAYWPTVHAGLGPFAFAFLLAGGAMYTIGAVVYATRWPDPAPAVFGFHEVFHVFVILGSACHFVAVARVVVG